MQNLKTIWVRRAILWSALLGLFASAYLFYTYTTNTTIKCGVLHGCDLVQQSKWASIFGIPTPTFGLIFYCLVIAVLIIRAYSPAWQSKWLGYTQKLIGAVGILESAYLFGVQTFIIKNYCTWCLVSALATLLIFIAVIFDKPIAISSEESDQEIKLYFWSLLAGAIVIALLIRLLV